MLYVALLTFLATSYGVPIPAQLTQGQLFYYPQPQFAKHGLHPFLHYSPEAKSIQNFPSQNDLFYYPAVQMATPQQVLVRNQPVGEVPASTSRFTAPPEGLVHAIYAWFAENNLPIPDGPQKNEILSQSKAPEKLENPDKTPQAGEAEILASAESQPNLPTAPALKPGQRFYILNNQPQFLGLQSYQPILPNLPQVVMRSALPEDQNLVFYRTQGELQQQNLKLRNGGIGVQNQEVFNRNVVLLKNVPEQVSEETQNVAPVRYHGDVKKILPNQVRPIQNFPQQLFLERLLPHGERLIPQQQTLYQTQYVPIGVVPPQENLQYAIQNQDPNQHLSFIQIPINKDIQHQLPPYIKTVVPIAVDASTKIPNQEDKKVLLQGKGEQGTPLVYLSKPEGQETPLVYLKNDGKEIKSRFASDIQGKSDAKEASDIAALEFVRYIASRQSNDFSDTVVIDAKAEEVNKEETETEVVQADEGSEPSVAQAGPAGIALAGPGGVAASAPRGTALAGDRGLAVSSPRATAVAGPNTQKEDKPSS